MFYRVIPTVRKHIVSNNALPCGRIPIRIDKPTPRRIIISALQIVQPCLRVVDVSAVAQGVLFAEGGGQRAGGGQQIAPCVVGVGHNARAAGADERARARLNALHQIERAVGKAVIRARGRGNRREQVACVAVSHGGRALADAGGAELPVVAVVRAGALRLAGGLHPLQHSRLQVVAVGRRLPERIRDARELVAVRTL